MVLPTYAVCTRVRPVVAKYGGSTVAEDKVRGSTMRCRNCGADERDPMPASDGPMLPNASEESSGIGIAWQMMQFPLRASAATALPRAASPAWPVSD